MSTPPKLHHVLDWEFDPDVLSDLLENDADPDERSGPFDETALHVAARRYRTGAIQQLIDAGAAIDARTKGGKTAYAHARRRGFDDLASLFRDLGADTTLSAADEFAVALVAGGLEEARRILDENPQVARTGNPEEDRLLADLAGRDAPEAVRFLIEAGASLDVAGLDGGTPLHQAAWFGQPRNVELLVEAGAPLEVFDPCHHSSPLGWAVHGSRCSGGAEERQNEYVTIVRTLLERGAALTYPDDPEGSSFRERLLRDASPEVAALLQAR